MDKRGERERRGEAGCEVEWQGHGQEGSIGRGRRRERKGEEEGQQPRQKINSGLSAKAHGASRTVVQPQLAAPPCERS